MSKFQVLKDGQLLTFSRYEDIPQSFDNLISFEPDYPPEPHTEEQHEEISKYNNRLKELLKRETR